ncbi:MAG: DNA polymerase III subunit gamma/tau, partial [Solirubrobacteraceae bacterium]
MLSRAAWNALLKTIEEPPPHTLFILATTDAHKVPATIVDRCHRFHLHAAPLAGVPSLIERVSAAERIAISPEARTALANVARGSYREALALLDQVRHYADARIELDDVRTVASLVEDATVDAILSALAAGRGVNALTATTSALADAAEPQALAGALEARLRSLLVVQTL